MDACKQKEDVTIAQPIAVGPCMFFKKPHKRKTRSARVWLRSLFVRSSDQSRLSDLGQWVDSFLTLHSDSTLCVRDGSCQKDDIVASVKLVDVYREIVFGEGMISICVPEEVPTMNSKFRSSMLGVPDAPNNQMLWLFFFSQHTLYKWLVAVCRSIPAERFNEVAVSQVCHQHLRQKGKDSPSLALKNHIHLFFPSRDAGHVADSPAMNEFKISVLPNRPQCVKKNQKGIYKGPRGSRVK